MHHIDIDSITLDRGAHDKRTEGVCLLEAVAWWAEERHTDHPACVSVVLGAYGRALNDRLPDEARQQLRPFIVLLPGTADDDLDDQRRWMAADFAIRDSLPAWLEYAGLTGRARELRALTPITDETTYDQSRQLVGSARNDAYNARSAAWSKIRKIIREKYAADAADDAAADAVAADAAVA